MLQNIQRRVAGSVLFTLSIVFFWLAFTSLAHADSTGEIATPDCHALIAKELGALIDQDQNQILDLQLKLTTLKLAAAAKRSRSITVEKYIKSETAEIEGKDTNGIREKLVQLYQQNGQGEDAATAVNEIEPVVAKFQKGSYWSKDLRFKNEDLSAFVLAHSLSYPNETPFSQEDAAILWMQAQISRAVTESEGRGSATANLQEVSTQVARMTGAIQGAANFTESELDEKASIVQAEIDAQFSELSQKFTDGLKTKCFTLPDGTPCVLSRAEQSSAFFETIQEVASRLESDQAYLNQKVLVKLGHSIRESGADLAIDQIAPEVGPKTEVQSVSERFNQQAPFLNALRNVAEKGNESSTEPSEKKYLFPLLPIGSCDVRGERLTTEDGKLQTKLTLTPPGASRKIEVWSPLAAPMDNTQTQAFSTAIANKGRLLNENERHYASLVTPENQRIAGALHQELKDGPCFKPAR